jgi:NADH-quinone oxidoreductase subunit E
MKMDLVKPLSGDDEEATMLEDIASELSGFEKERSALIPILQLIQKKHAYLSEAAMQAVASHLGISASEIYGVATFYNQFRFHPPGRHQIKVCMGTACHVVGGEIILENFERKLGIKEGETTPDREFSIERVACVGCCALAPVAVVDETVQAHMAPSKVEGLLLGFQIEKDRKEREEAENRVDG